MYIALSHLPVYKLREREKKESLLPLQDYH
jgi:hypothetical protein